MAWTPNDWRKFPAKHIPEDYPDTAKLAAVEGKLAALPPLVFAGEVRELKRKLAKVSKGEAFLLQGGDCAESFKEFSANNIRDTFRLILQMALVLTYAGKKPVVKVGRIAGQFGKPRSSPIETQGDITLPSYRGDNINGMAFTPEARVPNPDRLLQGYTQSAATLNLLRAFSQGGYADLTNLHKWTLEFVAQSPQGERYGAMAAKITEAMDFMAACGINSQSVPSLSKVDFFTSHEALLLGYEQAMTREDSTEGGWYDTSAHMVWIGHRTRQTDHAHVQFCKGIENPIGLKCGPGLEADELVEIIQTLNPSNEAGKIVLIARFGADGVAKGLPPLVRAVVAAGQSVVWSCDPMHGNTQKAATGYKTRPLPNILSEVQQFIEITRAEGAHPGGVHFEMTGQDVTECTGGAQEISDEDLSERYHTHCDPRLNGTQALELAFLMAESLSEG